MKREATAKRHLNAWYGTKDDMIRLFAFLEAQYPPAPADTPIMIEMGHSYLPDADLSEGEHARVSGRPSDILDSASPLAVRDFTYTYPGYGVDSPTRTTIEFHRHLGVDIRVYGENEPLVRAMAETMEDQAKRNRPWWSWFTASQNGWMVLWLVTTAILGSLTLGIIGPHGDAWMTAVIVSYMGWMTVLVAPIIAFVSKAPTFQVLPDGASPLAWNVLRPVTGVLVAALVGAVFTLAIHP